MTTRLFLDTEFNGFNGELISMALVPERAGRYEFYEVVELPPGTIIDPWVAQHVMPKLGQRPISIAGFRYGLAAFLKSFHGLIEIYADWPCDFTHLLRSIVRPHGERVNVNFTMHLVSDMSLQPDNPHNALSDARALRDGYLQQHTRQFPR